MPPHKRERRLIDRSTGNGRLVFPDGTAVPVSYLVEVYREFLDEYPSNSEITGRVWSESDPFLANRYLAKDCVLHMERGRRFSMFIIDAEGTLGHSASIVEGFPDLKR